MGTTKEQILDLSKRANMREAGKETYKGYEIYVAEGYSDHPHVEYRRFFIDEKDFPYGAYMSMWWVAEDEDHFDVGRPMFFASDHDPQMPVSQRPKARTNAALNDAKSFIERRLEARTRNYA